MATLDWLCIWLRHQTTLPQLCLTASSWLLMSMGYRRRSGLIMVCGVYQDFHSHAAWWDLPCFKHQCYTNVIYPTEKNLSLATGFLATYLSKRNKNLLTWMLMPFYLQFIFFPYPYQNQWMLTIMTFSHQSTKALSSMLFRSFIISVLTYCYLFCLPVCTLNIRRDWGKFSVMERK